MGVFGYFVAEVIDEHRFPSLLPVWRCSIDSGPNRRAARSDGLHEGAVLCDFMAVVSIAFSLRWRHYPGIINQFIWFHSGLSRHAVWLWISSFLVLLGASCNAQVELRTRPEQHHRDLSAAGEPGARMLRIIGRVFQRNN